MVLQLLGIGSLRRELVLVFDADGSARLVGRVLRYPFGDLFRMGRAGLFELGARVDVGRSEPLALENFGLFLFEFSRHRPKRRLMVQVEGGKE